MMHKHRTWVVSHIASPDDLAQKLAEHTWCCCQGFAIVDYLLLNDATCAEGAQEYAVVKRIPQGDGTFADRQIESITASWMTQDRILEFLCRLLTGEMDDVDWAFDVQPRIENPEEHGRCHLCA